MLFKGAVRPREAALGCGMKKSKVNECIRIFIDRLYQNGFHNKYIRLPNEVSTRRICKRSVHLLGLDNTIEFLKRFMNILLKN